MMIKGTAKTFYQAYRYINGNFTKKQREEAHLVLEVEEDRVRLIAVGEEAYYISTLQGIEVIETGVYQVSFDFIEGVSDRLEDIHWEIYSDLGSLVAKNPKGETVEGYSEEVELMIEPISKVASFKHEDIGAMFTELLANTVKTGRAFTDTLLLRMRRDQLNGRTITMQSIVINSVQSETDNKGLIDIYLSKPHAQALNKSIKLFNKKEELHLLKEDGQVGFESGDNVCILLEVEGKTDMPNVTGLMRRINRLEKDEEITINVDDWKKELNALQKETPQEERDLLRQRISQEGAFVEHEENSVIVSVKSLLKLMRSIQSKKAQLYIMDLCLIFKYETDTRTHVSVVMTGKG